MHVSYNIRHILWYSCSITGMLRSSVVVLGRINERVEVGADVISAEAWSVSSYARVGLVTCARIWTNRGVLGTCRGRCGFNGTGCASGAGMPKTFAF
jgi:deoxycytidine triphosphate deaminase